MPAVKSVSEIAEKWGRRAGTAGPEYEAGVKAPKRSWEKATTDAVAAYKEGVTASLAKGSFEKGVKKAGDAKWSKRTVEVGPSRFQQGVQVATPEYEKGFAPFRDVIERTTLPPRFAKGDPRNIDRVRAMAKALFDAKGV